MVAMGWCLRNLPWSMSTTSAAATTVRWCTFESRDCLLQCTFKGSEGTTQDQMINDNAAASCYCDLSVT
jgi:hypothetical protein